MHKIAIIADDLTGGADTGVQFCPYLSNTILVTFRSLSLKHLDSLDGPVALSVYTNSRSMAPDAARKRLQLTARRLSAYKPDWIYKKVDSCLRGNLGAETEALMDEMGYDLSVIAPAFPEMGRTTIGDIHRVNGVPLNRTEMAQDPVTPVSDSRLSRVTAHQSRYPVGHVALRFIEGSERQLQIEIERHVQSGIKHLVFDAVSQTHLDRIARLVLTAPYRIIPVGSAGLALSLGCQLFSEPVSYLPGKMLWREGHRLLVCGTESEITRRQIEFLLTTYAYETISFSPQTLTGEDPITALADMVTLTRLKLAHSDVVLKIDSSQCNGHPDGRERIQRQEMARAIVHGLGQFVAAVMAEVQPGLLFMTGGDTADAVLSAVGAGGIRILDEITTGVVEGTLFGGAFSGLPVTTKAGAFGQKETLVVLHNIWQKRMKGQ